MELLIDPQIFTYFTVLEFRLMRNTVTDCLVLECGST